ncbi:MAG: hypothetical protein ACLTQL_02160 [Eisenbergiella sp.]
MAGKKKQRIETMLLWGSVLIFTALYISLIFNQNVWTDEIFTMKLLKEDFAGIVEGTAKDVHPPLYYLIAKTAQLLFGESLQVQKIVTLIPMSLTLALGAGKLRKQFGFLTGLFYIWIAGCIPCTMEFAVQVRMYSMALLAVTCCGIYAWECWKEGKKSQWTGLALSALAAAYLHYFALVSVLWIIGILFLAILFGKRERLRGWLIAAACMAAGYAPWLGTFLEQFSGVSESYWIPPITWETVAGCFQWAFGIHKWQWPGWLFTGVLVGAAVWLLIGTIRQKSAPEKGIFALLCLSVPALTMALGLGLSFLIRPIYRDQYALPAMGLLSLFLAMALAEAVRGLAHKKKGATARGRRDAAFWGCAVILGGVCLLILFLGAVQYLEVWRQEYKSTLTDQTLEFWEENVGENDLIVYNLEVYEFCYSYYFPEEKLAYVRDVDLSQDFDTIWFLDTPGEWEFVPDQILPYDLRIEYEGHYGIEHNEFDIYRVTKGEGA